MTDDIAIEAEDITTAELNDEIITLKKKIQLSEGQRKAQYEEYDSEKKKNIEEIRRLKKEIRELSACKPTEVDEDLLKVSKLPIKELKEYLNKPPEEVERILDLKNIDLQKKLDLIKYEIFQKQERILYITKQMEDFLMEIDQEALKKYAAPIKKEVSRLENKIHLVNVNVLEMRHMQKKYFKIKQSLQEDSVYFESTLKKFEDDIAKEKAEIQRLQEVKDEAFRLRDKTRNALAKLEAEVIAEGIQREAELLELRKKVEEGRAYLERVERKLVPSIKTLARDDSNDDLLGETEEQAEREMMEKAIAKLKHVTGAKDETDILKKFKAQRDTKDRLIKLKETVEDEKKELEKKKENLESELEALKFAQVKEKEQNEEDLEKLKNSILEKRAEKKKLAAEFENDEMQLNDIKEFFYDLCRLMEEFDDTPVPDKKENNSEIPELIEVVEKKINRLMKYVDENNLIDEIIEQDMNLDEGLGIEDHLEKKMETEKDGGDKNTELTDVPTRSFLKRQSQLIVEAKTRKRGFTRDTPAAPVTTTYK